MTDRITTRETVEQVEARARRAAEVAAECTEPSARVGLELEAARLSKQALSMRLREKRLMLRR